MKAGPPAATFDIEVTFGMECMHRRVQNPTSLGPEVGAVEGGGYLTTFSQLPGFLYMKERVLPA